MPDFLILGLLVIHAHAYAYACVFPRGLEPSYIRIRIRACKYQSSIGSASPPKFVLLHPWSTSLTTGLFNHLVDREPLGRVARGGVIRNV